MPTKTVDIPVHSNHYVAVRVLAQGRHRGRDCGGWTACARRNGIRGDCRSTSANGFVRCNGGNVRLRDLWRLPPASGHVHFLVRRYAGGTRCSDCVGGFSPLRYRGTATTIAAGIISFVGGVLRLGSVSQFISKPVLKGFVFGLALTIMVKQGPKLMGISAGHGNFFHQAWHVITSLSEVNPWTLAVGATAVGIMFLLGAFPRIELAIDAFLETNPLPAFALS
jgi:hypothetical protein